MFSVVRVQGAADTQKHTVVVDSPFITALLTLLKQLSHRRRPFITSSCCGGKWAQLLFFWLQEENLGCNVRE